MNSNPKIDEFEAALLDFVKRVSADKNATAAEVEALSAVAWVLMKLWWVDV